MYKIIHLPTAEYIKWYKNWGLAMATDIIFDTEKDAQQWIDLFQVRKSIDNITYLLLIQPPDELGINNLKLGGYYVPKEHLAPVEVT